MDAYIISLDNSVDNCSLFETSSSTDKTLANSFDSLDAADSVNFSFNAYFAFLYKLLLMKFGIDSSPAVLLISSYSAELCALISYVSNTI